MAIKRRITQYRPVSQTDYLKGVEVSFYEVVEIPQTQLFLPFEAHILLEEQQAHQQKLEELFYKIFGIL